MSPAKKFFWLIMSILFIVITLALFLKCVFEGEASNRDIIFMVYFGICLISTEVKLYGEDILKAMKEYNSK